jgi:hypothetical protein
MTRRRGGRRRADAVASSLCTTRRTADGGELRITSQRRHDQLDRDDVQRAFVVHNFLARAGLANDDRVERRDVTFGTAMTQRLLAVPDDTWTPFSVVIDGTRQDFEPVVIDGHWLAIGIVEETDVAVEAHGVNVEPFELVRLDRPAGSAHDALRQSCRCERSLRA